MWLESHGNLARHPKTRRLMQQMGWTLPSTIGNLHLLWYWALDFAPTGDLTRFEPEQLTYDLDLGDATPEQFIEAMVEAGFIDRLGSGSAESRSGGTMVEAGFIDRSESATPESRPGGKSGTLRLHDWPEYTAKSLRPRFRRHPERWHQVLRSYGLPVITRRTSRRDTGATTPDQTASSSPARAGREDQMVVPPWRDPAGPGMAQNGSAIPADSAICTNDVDSPQVATGPSHDSSSKVATVTTEQQMANMRRLKAELPRSLSLVPGFADKWWPRLLDMYETKGAPLDCRQRKELLALLSYRPNSATRLLEHCIENSLECKWEHLDNSA